MLLSLRKNSLASLFKEVRGSQLSSSRLGRSLAKPPSQGYCPTKWDSSRKGVLRDFNRVHLYDLAMSEILVIVSYLSVICA